MYKIIWRIVVAVSMVIFAMTQISVQQAKSNIGSWLNFVGFNPKWAQFDNIDKIIMVFAGSVVVIPIVLFLIKVIQNKLPVSEEKIKFIGKQQKSKLQIYFDETDPSCVYDEYGDYGTNIGKIIHERTIRIRIDNLSKTNAIEGVEVKLTDIDKATLEQKGKLPVRLKLKDDTNNQYPFTIPIDDYKYLDVICAYRQDPRQPICDFGICHIEQKNYHEIPLSFHDVGTDAYKIKIEAKSNTTTCEPRYFMVGLKDSIITMWPA